MIKKSCFIIMPFIPELHYFYLYMKKHIEETHNIQCERADEQILTIPVLDKINVYIKKSDVIIADCSGKNPNVYYELGISHAYSKKVILITSDEIKEVPSDIRHYDFIKYNLNNDVEFINKLDNALRNIFFEDYKELYKIALEIFKEFKEKTKLNVKMVSKESFITLVNNADRTGDLPSFNDEWGMKEFLLPKIIAESDDLNIMREITKWLSEIELPG